MGDSKMKRLYKSGQNALTANGWFNCVELAGSVGATAAVTPA